MKKSEILTLLERVRASYPSFQPANIDFVVCEWNAIFGDMEYRFASLALTRYVREAHEFAPNAGIILDIAEKTKSEELSARRDPVEAFRKGTRCKWCKDTGFLIRRVFDPEYGYEVEVAQICGECNGAVANALAKGKVKVFYSNDGFKKVVGEAPFEH